MKTSPFLNDDPEVRRAEQVFEQPQWLEGHRTQIGLALASLGMLGNWFGFKFPQAEVSNLVELVGANWDGMAQVAGGAIAVYGNIMKAIREARLKKAVMSKTAVAARAEEKLAAKTNEAIEVRTALHEVKAEVAALKNGRKATTT